MIPVDALANPLVLYIAHWAEILGQSYLHNPSVEVLNELDEKQMDLIQLSRREPDFVPYRGRISGDLRTFWSLRRRVRDALQDRSDLEEAMNALCRFLDAHAALATLALASEDPVGVYFNLDRALIAGALGIRSVKL